MEHPLCEICEARGIVTPAVDVHHKESFTRYEGERMLDAAFDPGNLVSVCRGCHNWLHHGKKTAGLNIDAVIEQMDEEFGRKRP